MNRFLLVRNFFNKKFAPDCYCLYMYKDILGIDERREHIKTNIFAARNQRSPVGYKKNTCKKVFLIFVSGDEVLICRLKISYNKCSLRQDLRKNWQIA